MKKMFHFIEACITKPNYFQSTPTANRTIVMNQANRVQSLQNNQKVVVVTQRPQSGGNPMHQNQQNFQNQQNTVLKFVSNSTTQHTQKIVTSQQQKLVMVSMPTSSASSMQRTSHGNFMIQSNVTNPQGNQGSQPPVSMVPKPGFVQQAKLKPEQLPQSLVVDDLSHLA